jgi:hypothetical protein
VYEKNPDGWSSAKITTSIGRKMLCLPTPNMQVSAEQVPNLAVPADIRKNATHWRIIYQPRQQVAEKSNTDEQLPYQSFEQYLAKQSTQTQRLLSSGTLDSTEAREQKSAGFASIRCKAARTHIDKNRNCGDGSGSKNAAISGGIL